MMSDPTALLNIERHTGINNQEVKEWVNKTSAVSNVIRNLANGKLDPSEIDLKKYGILTPEQEAQEKERKKKVKQELERKQMEDEKRMREDEKRKWWDNARFLVEKTQSSSSEVTNNISNEKQKSKEKVCQLYSSDYSRWTDTNYVPDDDATKEEIAQQIQLEEQEKSNVFESNNSEFCKSIEKDIEERQKVREKKIKESYQCRMKGNVFYRKKQYAEALKCYKQAMTNDAYDVKTLTNIALCHSKKLEHENAFEFYNRACFINKDPTYLIKPLFQRVKTRIQLNHPPCDILADLEKCLELEDNNKEVLDLYNWFLSDLESKEREQKVHSIINCNDSRMESPDSTKNISAHRQSEVDLESEIKSLFDDFTLDSVDNKSLMQKKFDSIDLVMDKIMKHDLVNSMTTSNMLPYASSLLIALLKESNLCQAYFRIKGHLEIILALFEEAKSNIIANQKEDGIIPQAQNFEAKNKKRKILLGILTESINNDSRSHDVIHESKIVIEVLSILKSSSLSHDCMMMKLSACKFLHVILGASKGRGVYQKINLLIFGDYELVKSISLLILDVIYERKNLDSWLVLESVNKCVNLLLRLSDDEKLRAALTKAYKTEYAHESSSNIEETNNPIASTIASLLLLLKDDSVKTLSPLPSLTEMKEIRKMLVEFMINLAAVECFRPLFAKQLLSKREGISQSKNPAAVVVLLAIVKSFKSELELCRLSALTALTNATFGSEGTIQQSIIKCGGIPILLSLSTSSDECLSPLSIKSKSSALLCRCVTSNMSGMEALLACCNALKEIILLFISITLHPSFKTSNEGDRLFYGSIGVNLVQLLATVKCTNFTQADLEWTKWNQFIQTLIYVLPEPQINRKGIIDASSVCLPFRKSIPDSPHEIAFQSKSFHVNVTKTLISFLDVSTSTNANIDENIILMLIERLVCILSNSSSLHQSLVRNAATCLAKLVKNNEIYMKRCRELRGMEILLELGKNGKI